MPCCIWDRSWRDYESSWLLEVLRRTIVARREAKKLLNFSRPSHRQQAHYPQPAANPTQTTSMSLRQFYLSLTPRKKVFLGLTMMTWATLGLYISDKTEKQLGFEPSEQDKQGLAAAIPKIRPVDRD